MVPRELSSYLSRDESVTLPWCKRSSHDGPVSPSTNGHGLTVTVGTAQQHTTRQVQELTILWLELCDLENTGFPDHEAAMALWGDLAPLLLQRHGARYVVRRRHGRALLAGFDDATVGLLGAWYVRTVLQHNGVLVRIGMHCGCTVVHAHPQTSCIAMIGPSVQGAVQLASLAQPSEVLLTAELRHHAQVVQNRFEFIQQHRWLPEANVRSSALQLWACYVMALVSLTWPV